MGKKITWKLYQKQLFFFFGFCNMRRYVRILCWFKVGPPPSSNKIFNQPFLRNSVSSSQGFRKYSFKTIDFIFSWIEFASRNYYLKYREDRCSYISSISHSSAIRGLYAQLKCSIEICYILQNLTHTIYVI